MDSVRRFGLSRWLDAFFAAMVLFSLYAAMTCVLAIHGVRTVAVREPTTFDGRIDELKSDARQVGMGIGALLLGAASALGLRSQQRRRQVARAIATRRVQLAGMPCGGCEHDIVLERDAALCSDCKVPVHRVTCHSRHVTAAHNAMALAPYRGM